MRYPKATGEQYARGVTVALEKERQRLERWIPKAGNKPVEVYLFPMRDFFENFGGDMGVVGLFDGKVRVPFAEVRSLHPELLSILSHELAHAMIAAATHDQAPHWFQEGLAQHIEMGRGGSTRCRTWPAPAACSPSRRSIPFSAASPKRS